MKNLLLLCIFLMTSFIFAQEEKKVESKVVEATVFKNRALVTRAGETELSSGNHKLVFSNLPVDLLNESVRVSADGNGTVKILDVKVEQKFTTETQQTDIKNLEQKIDSINQLKQISADKIAIYESKKAFVESLKAKSAEYISEKSFLSVNSKSLSEVLKYVEVNLEEIFNGLRIEKLKINKYDQQINTLKAEISHAHGMRTKNFKEVVVTVETGSRGRIKLYPSYIVQSVNWYPVYDVRVTSDNKNAELSYYGMINQQTGEDWKDISLVLSTAEPMSVKSLPELDRWFIDVSPLPVRNDQGKIWNQSGKEFQITYDQNRGLPAGLGSITGYITDAPTGESLMGANVFIEENKMGSAADMNGKFLISNVPAGQYNLVISYIGYERKVISLHVREKNIANLVVPINPTTVDGEEIAIMGLRKSTVEDYARASSGIVAPQKEVLYTNVHANELSTSFEISTRSSIPSDNSPHKVTIAVFNSGVAFSYTSIPKITPGVYVKGKVVNEKDYPLLEGEINVFVDNDFINRTYLNTIVPTDTLSLALGIDERIQIKKVLINKYRESKGLLGGSRQITYEYEIQITNNRKTGETVVIYDQLPIAMNEEIKVELVEPEKSDKELGNDKKLEWNIELRAGEKKIVPIKYMVTYPNNVTVHGLE